MSTDPQRLPAVHEAWLPREHALHRPRHGTRQLTALICALVFFATPTLLWVVGLRPSEIENHALTPFPGVSDGWELFTDLPQWATDQLIFRSSAISAADGISRGIFGEPAPFDQGGTDKSGPLPGSPPPPRQADPPNGGGGPPEAESGYRRVIEGSNGWLYYGFDVDGKCMPVRSVDETLGKLNELRAAVEASGRKFVFAVAPDKTTMNPEHLPETYAGKECAREATEELWPRLTNEAGALDLREGLTASAQRLEHPVYSPNDTHWSDEGALVLTRELAEAIKPGTTASWTTQPAGQYTVDADLPPMLGRHDQKTNTRYQLRPDGVSDRATSPANDIDKPVRRTAPPIPGTVDENTLIYGDSFTKASSRYLGGAFNNLTMLAYYSPHEDQNATLDAFTNSEVVVLETVERSVAAGQLPLLDDAFIESIRARLAAHPLR